MNWSDQAELRWAQDRAHELANLGGRDYSVFVTEHGLEIKAARPSDETDPGHLVRVRPTPAPAGGGAP